MINLGTIFLRSEPCSADATIIVTGVGRSGTSMIAGVLASLGLYMGPDEAAVHEDPEMVSALLYFLHQDRAALIARRNQTHQSWGFKFPSLARHMHPPELAQFRSPRLVVVTRDLTAVAARAALSDPDLSQPKAALSNIAEQQMETVRFIIGAACPALILSYEKFLARPRLGATTLANFCGLKTQETQLEAAAKTVTPESPAYMQLFNSQTPAINGHSEAGS